VWRRVELHLRASFWRAHGHEADPRYNGLVLHVVLARTAAEGTTRLASGRRVPVVLLCTAPASHRQLDVWPCAGLAQRLTPAELRGLLVETGMARFAARVARFAAELQILQGAPLPTMLRPEGWSAADRVLFPAVAESLGYGRDRASLRRAGGRLAAGESSDEVAILGEQLPIVEGKRLKGLLVLYARWRLLGPWAVLWSGLGGGPPARAGRALIERLSVASGDTERLWIMLRVDIRFMREKYGSWAVLVAAQPRLVNRSLFYWAEIVDNDEADA
jgi:hypothetical protein